MLIETFKKNASEYVLFSIDSQLYALPLCQVERVIRLVAITVIPEVPTWLAGVINMAGKFLPVIDLRQRLGMSPRQPRLSDRMLIVKCDSKVIVLIVDEVEGVLSAPSTDVNELNEQSLSRNPVSAILQHENKTALVLDSSRLWISGTWQDGRFIPEYRKQNTRKTKI